MSATIPMIPNPKLDLEIQLEQLFNKNQLTKRIATEFRENMTLLNYINHKEINEDFAIGLLVQMVLHKRTTLPTLVGILKHHFEDSPDPCQRTTDELLKAAEADLVDWDPLTEKFIICGDISDEAKHELELFQYPLPMVIAPKTLHANKSTPYYALKDGSVILRKNHHNDDVCLDHINRVNSIRFSLDMDTATMIQNKWRHLDKPEPGEKPEEFEKRKKAFEKYDRTARDIMTMLVDHAGNEFYLTHKYDKRGRVYCQGYHVNYQGAPWNKAVIQLADKELVE